MSTEISSPQSEIVPAFMLATLLAVTGLEAAFLLAAPHKVEPHPVRTLAEIDGGNIKAYR